MTLPNWTIRIIIVALCPVLFVWAIFDGAWRTLMEVLFPHIRDAWRNPDYTRWGKNRFKS